MRRKTIVAKDLRPGKDPKSISRFTLFKGIIESRCRLAPSTNEEHTHIILPTFYDSHNHPGIYGMINGADPIFLGETKDKEEILRKIKQRAEKDGPIIAMSYNMEAGITSKDLGSLGLSVPILLMSTSLHGGVADSRTLKKVKRKTELIKPTGELKSNGELTEGYFFTALGMIEEQVSGLSDAIYNWVMERVKEGTTLINERCIFSEAEFYALIDARRRLIQDLEYDPIKEVYLFYPSFKGKLKKFAYRAGQEGIEIGVKFVGDGGTTSNTATLQNYTYNNSKRPQGIEATIPINEKDSRQVRAYLNELEKAGIQKQTIHAIGDLTISRTLVLAELLAKQGIRVNISHFQLPTIEQTLKIRDLSQQYGITIDMQPGYSTEGFRYESLKHLAPSMNPVKLMLQFIGNRLSFGTDGMPDGMATVQFGCAIGHPELGFRITPEQYLVGARDTSQLDSFVLMDVGTYTRIMSMRDSRVLAEVAENLDASAAEMRKGVQTVINGKII